MNERHVRRVPGLAVAYPFIVGAVASVLLIATRGGFVIAVWLYLAVVIAAVTFVVDRALRLVFDHWAAPPPAFTAIPVIASSVGLLVGSWALLNTTGGPV